MLIFTFLSLWTLLVMSREEGGSGSEEQTEKQCHPSLPPPCPSRSPSVHLWSQTDQSQLFADLSREELTAVTSFMTLKHRARLCGCSPGPTLRQLCPLGRAAVALQACSPGPPGQGEPPTCLGGTGHRLLWRTPPAQCD